MRLHPLSLLLTLALLLSGLPAAPPARAAEPDLLYGSITYTENGPGAGTDGIATAMLLGSIGGPVAVARLQSSFGAILKLITAAGAATGNPTMSSVSNLINSTVPVDLAGMLPLSAYYQAKLQFALKAGADGIYALQSGTVTWTVRNSGQFESNGNMLQDKYSGGGSEALEPASDEITLEFNPQGKKDTFDLTINIDHVQPTTGESSWTAAEGAMLFQFRTVEGVETISGHVLGEEIPEEVGRDRPNDRGIYYTHAGPLSELTYTETYRNLLDAQVLVTYQIDDGCSATVTYPSENEIVRLPNESLNLYGTVESTTAPAGREDSLTWELPEFGGQNPEYTPEDHQGKVVSYRYPSPAPEDNAAFGPFVIRATFSGEALCKAPEPRNVRVFFRRGRTNNPSPDQPNWYYYWRQTAAAQGHRDQMIWDGLSADCQNARGYYAGVGDPAATDVIYICDMFHYGSGSTNPLTGTYTEGIDMFAAVVRHEWTHKENADEWWPGASYNSVRRADGSWGPDVRDLDFDVVPDARELDMGLDPNKRDTLGLGYRDAEYTAYTEDAKWPIGSADNEDWADPGKQSGS